MTLQITKHAEKRMNQRGVRKEFLSRLLEMADIEVPVGGRATLYRISRATVQRSGDDDRLARYGAIVSEDGALISIVPIHRSPSSRRYKPSRAA